MPVPNIQIPETVASHAPDSMRELQERVKSADALLRREAEKYGVSAQLSAEWTLRSNGSEPAAELSLGLGPIKLPSVYYLSTLTAPALVLDRVRQDLDKAASADIRVNLLEIERLVAEMKSEYATAGGV